MNNACLGLCLGLLLSLAPAAFAGIYSYVDAEGNRVFTDRPGANTVEQVEQRPINRLAPPPPRVVRLSPPVAPTPPPPTYQLWIVAPPPDATIRDNAGNLQVTASSQPALHAGHRYQLLLDGEPAPQGGNGPVFALQNVDRGTHQLAVEILDAKGRTLQRTAEQPLHLMRTSLHQRRMTNPCKKADYGVRPECPLKDKPKEKRDIPFVPFL